MFLTGSGRLQSVELPQTAASCNGDHEDGRHGNSHGNDEGQLLVKWDGHVFLFVLEHGAASTWFRKRYTKTINHIVENRTMLKGCIFKYVVSHVIYIRNGLNRLFWFCLLLYTNVITNLL